MGTLCKPGYRPDGCRFNKCDGQCHHPRALAGRRLPQYRPGRYCMWGEREFDAADFLRAKDAIRRTKRHE